MTTVAGTRHPAASARTLGPGDAVAPDAPRARRAATHPHHADPQHRPAAALLRAALGAHRQRARRRARWRARSCSTSRPGMAAFGVVMATFSFLAVGLAEARATGVVKRQSGTPGAALGAHRRAGGCRPPARAHLDRHSCSRPASPSTTCRCPSRSILAIVVTLVLASACFSALGLALAMALPSMQLTVAVSNGIVIPLAFISDMFMMSGQMPDWLATIGWLFPLKHLTAVFADALNPYLSGSGFELDHLAVIALWGLAGAVVATVQLRRDRDRDASRSTDQRPEPGARPPAARRRLPAPDERPVDRLPSSRAGAPRAVGAVAQRVRRVLRRRVPGAARRDHPRRQRRRRPADGGRADPGRLLRGDDGDLRRRRDGLRQHAPGGGRGPRPRGAQAHGRHPVARRRAGGGSRRRRAGGRPAHRRGHRRRWPRSPSARCGHPGCSPPPSCCVVGRGLLRRGGAGRDDLRALRAGAHRRHAGHAAAPRLRLRHLRHRRELPARARRGVVVLPAAARVGRDERGPGPDAHRHRPGLGTPGGAAGLDRWPGRSCWRGASAGSPRDRRPAGPEPTAVGLRRSGCGARPFGPWCAPRPVGRPRGGRPVGTGAGRRASPRGSARTARSARR